MGGARRSRLGACARPLPQTVRPLQRCAERPSGSVARTRDGTAAMTVAAGTRLMMTTDTVGGVWTYATGLARALGVRGVQVLLVTMGPCPSREQRAAIADARGVMLLETDLQLEWQDPQGSDCDRASAVLRDAVRRFSPDLLHFNGYREAAFG